MIETEHSLSIDAGIDRVWNHVQDMRRWALLFPGCRECQVIDPHDSRWVIKVGAGGLIKTVNVLVRVEQWAGPERVEFSYRLEGEPVQGRGSYAAAPIGAAQTQVALKVRVEGSGPMAPMWEAVSRPLLPQLAKSFAGRLKEQIEGAAPASRPASAWAVAGAWLRRLWRALFVSKTA